MSRCTICGRPPAEEHCEICHRVHRALQRMPMFGLGQMSRTDQDLIFDELDQPTEAINQ